MRHASAAFNGTNESRRDARLRRTRRILASAFLSMRYPSLARCFVLALVLCALPFTRAANSLAQPSDTPGAKLGLQTWTCRNMKFEEVVDFAVKHDIKYIEFIAQHFDPEGTKEETLRKKAILDQHGLVAYSFGVTRPGLDKEKNRKLFEFAKLMGIKVIAVEPQNQAAWDNIEQLVKEYDIKVAIHNHNLDTTYGNPETVKKILAARDHRIGVCLDLGWVTAAGFDAAEVFKGYGDRVYDMHLKDKVIEIGADGKKTPVDTEIGQGKANLAGVFAEVKKSKWAGVLAIETDSKAFAEDPNKLVSEAKTYFDAQLKKKK
jgi:L-ribulose-5-phosphate 3-epimerase